MSAVKVTSKASRNRVLKQVAASWDEHPEWGIGRLIVSAASIQRGELRKNPREVSDRDIMVGLRALIPDDDDVAPK